MAANSRALPSFIRIAGTIARHSYKEAVRDRLLYGILIIALLVTASSFFLASLSLGQETRVMQNIGYASIHLFSLFITVFIAATSISRDFERRALYLLFAKPVTRAQYVFGKFLGMAMLLLTSLLLLGGLFGIGAAAQGTALWSGLLLNLAFSFLENSLLLALAILFAAFTAPLNAALYTIALFLIGHSLDTLKAFAAQAGSALRGLITALYYLLPNLEKFDVRTLVLYGERLSAAQVGSALLYWFVWTALALSVAIAIMRRQEV